MVINFWAKKLKTSKKICNLNYIWNHLHKVKKKKKDLSPEPQERKGYSLSSLQTTDSGQANTPLW